MQHIVNIVNLPSRTDRLESIKREFDNREEFSINIVSPIYDKKTKEKSMDDALQPSRRGYGKRRT